MSSFTNGEWTLYYHGFIKMKGRGEYIRIIFEAARVPFKEIGDHSSIIQKCDSFSFPDIGDSPVPVIILIIFYTYICS